jgi:DNA-binding NarL/FixJ family response regulator
MVTTEIAVNAFTQPGAPETVPPVAEQPPAVATVAVVSRYPSVRAGLRVLLESEAALSVVAEAASPELLRVGRLGEHVDVVVIDLSPGQDVEELALEVEDRAAGLVFLGADERTLREATELLPRPLALLPRDADGAGLVAAVRATRAGLFTLDATLAAGLVAAEHMRTEPLQDGAEELTPRELEVLRLLVEGIPNKMIARRLGISDHTVKFHVGSVLSKLGAASRTEAVRLAARRGLVAL